MKREIIEIAIAYARDMVWERPDEDPKAYYFDEESLMNFVERIILWSKNND